jgi:hypothetical protein
MAKVIEGGLDCRGIIGNAIAPGSVLEFDIFPTGKGSVEALIADSPGLPVCSYREEKTG